MTRHTPVTPSRNALTCSVTGRTSPRHAPYAENIPNWKEPPTDDPQTTYRSTRTDSDALIATLQPGTHLYIQHDGHTSEWVVTEATGALRSPVLARAGDTTTRVTLHQLLARCGAIHTQPPSERTTT